MVPATLTIWLCRRPYPPEVVSSGGVAFRVSPACQTTLKPDRETRRKGGRCSVIITVTEPDGTTLTVETGSSSEVAIAQGELVNIADEVGQPDADGFYLMGTKENQ